MTVLMTVLRFLITLITISMYVNGAEPARDAQVGVVSNSEMAKNMNLLSYAKQALVDTTNVAKQEFGMSTNEDTTQKNDSQAISKVEPKYNTMEYRDIFYTLEESALINQSIDYFKMGKKINFTQQFTVHKTETVVKPIVKLFSVMYNNSSAWIVSTSSGRFSNNKPTIDNISIKNVTRNNVTFAVEGVVVTHERQLRDSVKFEGSALIFTLKNGECIFENNFEVTHKCTAITQTSEERVEVK